MSTAVARLDVLLGVDARQLERSLTTASQRVKKFGDKLNKVGKTLSTRVTLPLAAAGAAAFKMASDAEESANKFNVVMGAAADDVRNRLEAMTQTIPMTRSEMEGLAAGIQDMLVPMGLARTEAAGMSADMVQFAGDLGSFNNVPTARVLEAMKSALAGSSEPMRAFGVDTRVAALEQVALAEGIIKAGEELDNTTRAMAVMAAIQRDSTDAMGDAARTVNSTANQVKFLFRNIRQLAINIGEVLIPVITPLIQKLNKVLEFLLDLEPSTLAFAASIAAVAAAVGPVLVAVGSMTSLMGMLGISLAALAGPAGTIAAVTAAVAILAGAAVVIVKNWDVVKVRFALIWAAIKDAAFSAVSGILGGLERLTRFIPGVRDRVASMKESFDEWAEGSMANSGRRIAELERQLVDNFTPGVIEAAGGMDQFNAAASGTAVVVDEVTQAINHFNLTPVDMEGKMNALVALPRIRTELKPTWEMMADDAVTAMDQIGSKTKDIFGQGLDAVADFATGSGEALGNFVKGAIKQIGQLFAKILLIKALDAVTGGLASAVIRTTGAIAGARANGGPVTAGQPFLVGERGPEVFVPGAGGQIVPNTQMAGMGGMGLEDIESVLGPKPTPMTPREVMQDAWYRELFQRGNTIDSRRRGN